MENPTNPEVENQNQPEENIPYMVDNEMTYYIFHPKFSHLANDMDKEIHKIINSRNGDYNHSPDIETYSPRYANENKISLRFKKIDKNQTYFKLMEYLNHYEIETQLSYKFKVVDFNQNKRYKNGKQMKPNVMYDLDIYFK
jgi:hypothetical protein